MDVEWLSDTSHLTKGKFSSALNRAFGASAVCRKVDRLDAIPVIVGIHLRLFVTLRSGLEFIYTGRTLVVKWTRLISDDL